MSYKEEKIKVPRFNEESGFYTTKERSKHMSKIRGTGNKLEIRFRKEFWKRGFRYRVNVKTLMGKPDIVFNKYKTVVFIDGEFWHGYNWEEKRNKIKSNRAFWIPKIERNIQRDQEVNQTLNEQGFTVFRFWEKELKNNFHLCLEKVIEHLENTTMNLNHTSKLPNLKTTIFTVIGEMTHRNNALNLSQGFPNFPVDPQLIRLVNKAMKAGKNQYAPMAGDFKLRKTLTEKMNLAYGSSYHPESDITITAGATQAIFTAISAFIRKDDEVIVFKPAYDCYEPGIELNGGKPVLIQMKAPEYKIDWEEVKQKITPKTKMILINTPHNPSGKMLSENDMKTLESLLENTNILLLSDEVYEHITFDGKKHLSVAKFPKLAERALITFSFGKTFHVTGWKTGYCVAPKTLMQEFQKVHQYNIFCANHPIQVALNNYLQVPERYLGLSEFYQQKRDLFLKSIEGSRFEFTASEGTYFQLLNYSKITSENDMKFTEHLIKEYKLAAIPVSGFSKNQQDDKMLRFCFAKTDDTLKKAGEIICGI